MTRSLALAAIAIVTVMACGQAPSALSVASSSRVSPSAPAASASRDGIALATDSYPNAPRTRGMLGNGVFGYPLMVSSDGQESGTWFWDEGAWQKKESSPQPSSYFTSRPVFDPLLGRTVALAGGATGDPITTWAWDGSAWSNLNASLNGFGPPLLAFDAATTQLIAVISSRDSGTVTWVLEGGQWQRVDGPNVPQARWNAGFAYDPSSRQLVLFGGISWGPGLGSLADTWTWDGKSWTQRHPQTNPPPGWSTLAYDDDSQKMILVNVTGIHDGSRLPTGISMWTWDGADWHKMSPTRLPPAGEFPSLTYAPANHQLILFQQTYSTAGSQTWIYKDNTWARVG